jgi:hypothetical protein
MDEGTPDGEGPGSGIRSRGRAGLGGESGSALGKPCSASSAAELVGPVLGS